MQVAEGTILPSAARTTTQTVDAPSHLAAPMGATLALEVVMDTTAAATGSVTLSIEEYDEAKGGFVTRLASAAVTTVSVTRLTVGVSVPSAANASATGIVAKRWRVVATANNANSQTYSVSARIISD